MIDLSFQDPLYIVLAAAAGAVVLWSREGPEKLHVHSLAPVLAHVPWLKDRSNLSYLLQFAIFIVIGTFLTLLLTRPTRPEQAFAAGLGWTASLARKN